MARLDLHQWWHDELGTTGRVRLDSKVVKGEDWERRWLRMCDEAVQAAFDAYWVFPIVPLALYYKPKDDARLWGCFYLVRIDHEAAPPTDLRPVGPHSKRADGTLTWPDPIPCAERRVIANWLAQYSGQLPILGQPDGKQVV